MVEKPLVSPSVHPICGHEGLLWLIADDEERSPARPQGGLDIKKGENQEEQ